MNRGCVPSKMLIYPADIAVTVKEAAKIGINGEDISIDFKGIMERMRRLVNTDSDSQARAVENTPNLTWFKERGEFISDYTIKVGEHVITAEKNFIVSGARPLIPPVKGINSVDYLTSDTVLTLKEQPSSIVIIGGGYIGAEYSHFFASVGTKTTIIQRELRILPEEEPIISDLLKKEMEKE